MLGICRLWVKIVYSRMAMMSGIKILMAGKDNSARVNQRCAPFQRDRLAHPW